MALTDNLIAYWKLDESSGNAADATGGGKTFVNNGGVSYSTGKINNGADFANTYPSNNDSFSLASGNIADQTAFTISLWVKSSSTVAADSGLLTVGNWSGSGQLQLMIRKEAGNTGQLHFQGYGNSPDAETLSTATNLFNGSWRHIVVTYKTAATPTTEIYVDGSLDKSHTHTSLPTVVFNTATTYLGTWLVGTNYRGMENGSIDEVGIWSRVLSSTEVSELYNNGSGLAYPFTTGRTRSPSGGVALSAPMSY